MTVTSQALLLLALFFLGTTVRKMTALDCGGNYTSSDGVLLSPNYPNVYNSSCQCTYTISLSTISTILLIFDTFELEPIYRGHNVTISCDSNSSFVQRTYYWGNVAPPISIPWCDSARLFFQSDANNSYSVRGFKIRYQVSTIGCGNTAINYYTEPDNFGNIFSPNYPQPYNNNENCTYLIWTAQSSSFTLNFQSFNLESSGCQYDWVQIWCDDTGYKLPKYCGSTVPAPVSINNCKQVLVWFHTNEANVFGGFNLQYSAIPYGYDRFYYAGLSGTITSPNYPRSYTNTIRSYRVYPVGSVTFTFLSFDLEPFTNYSYRAYVRVDCLSGPGSNGLNGPFRGNNLPPPITFDSCSLVRVYYYSNNVPAARTGFSVQYQVNPIVANGAITTKPVNTAAYVGSQVQLNCTSSITGYLPSWTLSKDGTDANTTFIASFCVFISDYYTGTSQYSVVSGGLGVCNLVISNVTLADAGVYTCTDASLATFSAVVSVIEVLPNIDQEPEVVKGDVLSFQYSVKFASSVAPAATPPLVISWIANEKTVASSIINHPDTVISSHIVTAQPEVPSYGFKVNFSSPVNNSDYATNTPTFTYQGNTTSVNVLYWPEICSMTIKGDNNGFIDYNGSLQCNVSSNPPSSYQWLDHAYDSYTYGSTISVTHSGTYTCYASNVIRNNTYWSSKSITIDVSSPTTIVTKSTTYPVVATPTTTVGTSTYPVSSPTTTVASSTYPVSSPATTVATSAYSVFPRTTTVATSAHPGVGVIVPSVLLGICVIGYIVLALYYVMQRVRVKSNLPQDARQHSAENRGFEDTTPANLYADASPKVRGQPVYDNIPIPSIQSGSSKKPVANEARLYEGLSNASHEPVVYDSLQRLPE